MTKEERQAAPRDTPEHRVMTAVWMSPGAMHIDHIARVGGFQTRKEAERAASTLLLSGKLVHVGNDMYRLGEQ